MFQLSNGFIPAAILFMICCRIYFLYSTIKKRTYAQYFEGLYSVPVAIGDEILKNTDYLYRNYYFAIQTTFPLKLLITNTLKNYSSPLALLTPACKSW